MKLTAISEAKKQFLLIVLILTISAIATEIYTPSFSAMALGLATTANGIQWTVSLFVLALAASHLFYGPLSDIIGRKKVLIMGLSLAVCGSLLCVFSQTIGDLYIGRVLQGFGLGAPAVLWRPILRDRLEGDNLAKEMSYLAPLAISAIVFAPFLGGTLQTYFGWRANFSFLLLHICLVLLVVLLIFKESKPLVEEAKERKSFKFIVDSYKELFSNKDFMGYSFCCFLGYGAFFSWTVTAPVILLNHMDLEPFQVGKLMLFAALPMGVGAFLNGMFVIRFGAVKVVKAAISSLLAVSLFILLTPFYTTPTVTLLVTPMFFFTLLSGFIWPNLFTLAFKSFGHIAGFAASLYGLLQLSGGALFAGILSIVEEESQISLGGIMVFCQVASLLLIQIILKEKVPNTSDTSSSSSHKGPTVDSEASPLSSDEEELPPKSFA